MKKSVIYMAAALCLLTACDPSKDDISAPRQDLTAEQLADGFSVVQYSDENYTTESPDGNYIKFTTNPSRVVEVYQLDGDGNKSVLASGVTAGTFKLAPPRGSSPTQTIYIRTLNYDDSEVVGQKDLTVYVQTELEPAVRLLASDAYGSKVWKWDTSFRADGGAWGNGGYAAGDDWSSGIWWACPPADLSGQLQHAGSDQNGAEYANADAYMVIDDQGNITSYNAGGNKIAGGKYSVTGYDGTKSHASADGSVSNWSYGTLTTSEGAILFPYRINSNGTKPTNFEIVKLDANHLQIVDPGASPSAWGECTWWAFKSESDGEGALTDYGTDTWTWDDTFRSDKAVWGNGGYAAGDDWSSGIWWGMDASDQTVVEGQLNHAADGNGLKYINAYMTFDWKSKAVTSYDADGNQIATGTWGITNWGNGAKTVPSAEGSVANWAYGYLTTSEGAILWPYRINSNGVKPTQFEIVKLDGTHLQLVDPGAAPGAWAECTWWAFKKK